MAAQIDRMTPQERTKYYRGLWAECAKALKAGQQKATRPLSAKAKASLKRRRAAGLPICVYYRAKPAPSGLVLRELERREQLERAAA